MTQSSNNRSKQKQTVIPGLSESETAPSAPFSDSSLDAEGSSLDAEGSSLGAEGSPLSAEGSPLDAEGSTPDAGSTVNVDGSVVSQANPCPKCGATKVARSRPQGLDILQTRLLPKRPYRCLRCYHRFWNHEDFLADKRRIWSWLGIILFLLVLLLFSRGQSPKSVQAPMPGRSPDDMVFDGRGGADKFASGTPASEGALAEDTRIAQRQRQIIEDVGFSAPPKENPDSVQLESRVVQREEPAITELVPIPQASQPDVRRADEHLAIDKIEQESLLKVKIAYEVEQWRKAWMAGDSAAYLTHYGSNFVPAANMSIDVWRRQRTNRVAPERAIQVELSNFDVSINNDGQSSVVTFDQRYQAKNYVDSSRKELIWIRQGQEWKIASELEVK